jgi:multidrug resistance efflux pump
MGRFRRFRARVSVGFRRRLGQVPLFPVWLFAAAAFVVLARGRVLQHGVARGFAEAQEASVAPIEAGRLKEIKVVLGQTVKAGDTLAVMDDSFISADIAVAQADLLGKRANADAQREALESQVARGGIWVMKAKAGEQQDRAELSELASKVQRLEGLVANQLASKGELEDARAKLVAVKARVATYDTVLRPKTTETDGRNFLSVGSHTYSESVEVRLEPYQAAVAEAEAVVARLGTHRAALELKAPVDATVAVITHHPGEVLKPGDEVLRLVRVGSGRVVAFVPDRALPPVALGQHVLAVRPGSFDPGMTGTLVEVGGEIEQMPPRLWLAPQIPAFGRRLVFQLDHSEGLVPGEATDVRL